MKANQSSGQGCEESGESKGIESIHETSFRSHHPLLHLPLLDLTHLTASLLRNTICRLMVAVSIEAGKQHADVQFR